MHFVDGAGQAVRRQALEVELEVGEHAGVDQLAQLVGAHQVAEQVAVERERGGAALGERRVVLVHVRGDPAEQQRLSERRRLRRVDRHHPDLARPQLGQHGAQRGHIEHVLQALARRLEQHRERRVLRRHREQIGGALALLPQRRALAGSTAGQQQRPGRALAEARREQRRRGQRRHDEVVDLLGRR